MNDPWRQPITRCPEPTCGLEASQATGRELSATEHETTGTCKQGHIWTTRWFAERST